jgi:hypothetical protein
VQSTPVQRKKVQQKRKHLDILSDQLETKKQEIAIEAKRIAEEETDRCKKMAAAEIEIARNHGIEGRRLNVTSVPTNYDTYVRAWEIYREIVGSEVASKKIKSILTF